MPQTLPSAIASAIDTAHDQFVEGHTPAIPFIARLPQPAPQAALFEVPEPPRLTWAEWLAQLLEHVGPVLPYLGHTHQELRDAAQCLPSEFYEQCHREPFPTHEARLVAVAERRFGEPVPGNTLKSQAARVRDPKYWRSLLVRRVREAREHLHLKLGLVGAGGRQYCSDEARGHRRMQLDKQAQWLKETMLRATIDGKVVEMSLEKVVKGASQKLAKLYAFISAMDALGDEAGLTLVMLTTTLEGEWHANPQFKSEAHRWNGATPAAANRELGQRFQDVRRDLDKQDIALSGLWAGEPHADGCPHRHHWLMYDASNERAVFGAFLKYFPGKLKVRGDTYAGDVIVATREDADAGLRRPVTHAKEGAQVDVSVIDRNKGSRAGYVLKYVLKAVLPEATYEGLVEPLGPGTGKVRDKKLDAKQARKQLRTQQSVDAHRAVWRMRSFQLFGVRNCLSLWDELRRVQKAPVHPRLHELWRLARGGTAEGYVQTGEQQGDATGFLRAMGGLAAARPAQLELGAQPALQARLYSVPTVTRYGELGSRIDGVCLVERGEHGIDCVLEAVATRTVRWEMVAKVPAEGETTEGQVGATAPGRDKTAKTSRRPGKASGR